MMREGAAALPVVGHPEALHWVACPVCGEDRARPRFTKQGLAVVRCQICALEYVNPRPPVQQVAALYRGGYFAGAGAVASGAPHLRDAAMKAATARLRLDLLDPHRTERGRLLDVGCGGGSLVQCADKAGWSAIGLEPSADACRGAARERQARGEPSVRMIAGQLETAPFSDGRFHAVTMLDVLEHVWDPFACLVVARRLLIPGGLLLVETPNMAGWLPRLWGSRHPWVRPREHLTYFTPDTLRRLLERAGFRLRHLQTSARKIVTLDYVLALTEGTNPVLTAAVRRAVGWWHGLCRRPVSVPMALLIALAEAPATATTMEGTA
jgi:2-polyprenyl-3-methyl-5-hydroxy-6-metoxy-1,4-benzoquinol methylase